MRKSNLQVRIPEEFDAEIEFLSPGSKSAFVRAAIEEKIHREKSRLKEQEWINALQKKSSGSREDSDWLKAEVWGDK